LSENEYQPKPGDIIRGERWRPGDEPSGEEITGIVVDFDSDDTYQVLSVDSDGKLTTDEYIEGHGARLSLGKAKASDLPKEMRHCLGTGGPEHVFVIDWMEDSVPNVQVFADPTAVNEFMESEEGADDGTPDNLQLKLMEAVADPGERIDLGPARGVRFCSVAGNEVAP
jgi:hypothetical protein